MLAGVIILRGGRLQRLGGAIRCVYTGRVHPRPSVHGFLLPPPESPWPPGQPAIKPELFLPAALGAFCSHRRRRGRRAEGLSASGESPRALLGILRCKVPSGQISTCAEGRNPLSSVKFIPITFRSSKLKAVFPARGLNQKVSP